MVWTFALATHSLWLERVVTGPRVATDNLDPESPQTANNVSTAAVQTSHKSWPRMSNTDKKQEYLLR